MFNIDCQMCIEFYLIKIVISMFLSIGLYIALQYAKLKLHFFGNFKKINGHFKQSGDYCLEQNFVRDKGHSHFLFVQEYLWQCTRHGLPLPLLPISLFTLFTNIISLIHTPWCSLCFPFLLYFASET